LFLIEINEMKKNLLYMLLASVILVQGCSTDLDVTGEWKETMVVYGLLDQGKDTQFVKINKAFLGEGNALEYAQVKDSTQFVNSLTVTVKRVSDGTVFNLLPINKPKEAGTFYYPDQANALYYFLSPPGALNQNSRYDLTVTNEQTGTQVTSSTILVNDFAFTKPSTASGNFYFINPANEHWPFAVEWASSKNGRLYELTIRFHYTDSTASGMTPKYVDWEFNPLTTNDLGGGDAMGVSFEGVQFLKFIGSQIPEDPAVLKRFPGNVELMVTGGADDLNTFIEVNKPSTGLIQERPEFSNITNGLGIFSSRYTKEPFTRPMHPSTLDSLAGGQYTCKLKFIDSSGDITGCL
jgi:hypothetical protein